MENKSLLCTARLCINVQCSPRIEFKAFQLVKRFENSFSGNILQITSKEDHNWWQAKKIETSASFSPIPDIVSLCPSLPVYPSLCLSFRRFCRTVFP